MLLHNLDTLDLDATTLKALVPSHAHYDHTGGASGSQGATGTVAPLACPWMWTGYRHTSRCIWMTCPSKCYPVYGPPAQSPHAPIQAAMLRTMKSAPGSVMRSIPTAMISPSPYCWRQARR